MPNEKEGELLSGIDAVASTEKKSPSQTPELATPAFEQQISTFMAQFRSGPDPAVATILAETERHSEDNNLAGYRATLEQRDRDSQRNHEFRLEQLKHSAHEKKVVLYCSVAALVIGGTLSVTGNSQFGNPIMTAALTLLITLISGKLKIGE
ncbi:MAG: hypothetical protein ABR907_00735 [Terracidiphilus sp.]